MTTPGRLARFCVGAFAVLASALVSHTAIDLLGDTFLARDAYDFVPHQSRSVAVVAALLLLALAALRFTCRSLDVAAGRRVGLRAFVQQALPRNVFFFSTVISACSIPALVAMEAFDIRLSGAAIDEPGDLLAGGPTFSLPIVVVCAAAIRYAVCACLRFLITSRSAIVAALAAFVERSTARYRIFYAHALSSCRLGSTTNVLARRGGMRAPPPAR